MIYVTSDLHGCPLDTLLGLLDKAGFAGDDFLYVLGDVADRGQHGVELLLWLTQQDNAQLLLGNHEVLLLACSFLFDEVTEESLEALSVEKMGLLENWMVNGGGPTMAGFRKLMRRDPELAAGILDYLRDCPLYEWVEAGGREYLLVHGGLENFSPTRALEDYTLEELLMTRPELDTQYFTDGKTTVILGHTPTAFFGKEYAGKALHRPTWSCIDTGAAMGHTPMLLRLDDMAEFY